MQQASKDGATILATQAVKFMSDPRHGLLDNAVAALDFERLKWKLSRSSEAKMSPEVCDLAEREYRRFLTLKTAFPSADLVPSKLADEFWHAHILDTAAYARDCEKVFGGFLHHFPYFGIYGEDDKRNLDAAFAETVALYQSVFGESPPRHSPANCSEDDPRCGGEAEVRAKSGAARCNGHPCHAPGSCACRSPGACR